MKHTHKQPQILFARNIQSELTRAITAFTAQGFVIAQTSMTDGFPSVRLTQERKDITVYVRDFADSNRTSVMIVTPDGAENPFSTFYNVSDEQHPNIWVDNKDDFEYIANLRNNRTVNVATAPVRQLNVKKMIPAIRKIKNFKSVPMKNLKITKDDKGYSIENITTRNKTVILLKK